MTMLSFIKPEVGVESFPFLPLFLSCLVLFSPVLSF
jgi:hypothetical protein